MPARTTYRRALYKALGFFEQGTASGGANNTTAQLECTDYPFKSSVLDAAYWKDKWLYRPNAAASGDKTRIVSSPTPASGLFTPDLTWTNAPTSEVFEILGGSIDPDTAHECVNEGLKVCFVVDEFTFTVNSNQTIRHSMSAQSWLIEPSWVLQVGLLASGENRNQVDPYRRVVRGRATSEDYVVYLETPRGFNTTDTVYVKAMKPAYHHCKASGGSYGDLTSGLTAETDEAPVPTDWLVQAALVCDNGVYDRLMRVAPESDRRTLQQQRAEAAARFTRLTRAYFKPPSRSFVPVEWMGPALHSSARRSRMW